MAYHDGWTLKRVRERVIIGRGMYEALAEDISRLQCTREELLLLIGQLAFDYEEDGRHLLRPDSATSSFFENLHVFAETFFSEKVSLPLPGIVMFIFFRKQLNYTSRKGNFNYHVRYWTS